MAARANKGDCISLVLIEAYQRRLMIRLSQAFALVSVSVSCEPEAWVGWSSLFRSSWEWKRQLGRLLAQQRQL